MGTVISNNTGSNNIAYPDYWSPGFDLTACVYAGLFSFDDLTINLAPNGVAATQVGTTVRDGVFPRFKAGNFYLATNESAADSDVSIVCVYKKVTVLGMGSGNRAYLVSSYVNAGNDKGVSLLLEGGTDNTINPPNVSCYRWAGLSNGTVLASGGNTASTDGWSISFAESWQTPPDASPGHARIVNWLNNGSASSAPSAAFQSSTNKIAIGSRLDNNLSGTQEATIAAVLIFKRRLNTTDQTQITAYMRSFLQKRGIIL